MIDAPNFPICFPKKKEIKKPHNGNNIVKLAIKLIYLWYLKYEIDNANPIADSEAPTVNTRIPKMIER